MVKNMRVWTALDPKTYQRMLVAIASTVTSRGKKTKQGAFIEQAIIEKLDRMEGNDAVHEYSED